MRVLILTTHLNPGGISRYVLNLAKGLNKKGNCIWVSCAEGEWLDILKREGINYRLIPIKTKSILAQKLSSLFLSFYHSSVEKGFSSFMPIPE
jgi:glycosyltransferase involved in cell wall biosynthesis